MTREEYQNLCAEHQNWKQIAFENLRNSIIEGENFYTQFKTSDDGKRLIFIAFMHSDGIGSSRILLSYELEKSFPAGYYLAFPDRSCGLVIAKNIQPGELAEVKKLIKTMHKGATIPMSGHLHDTSDIDLPRQWLQPLDAGYSEILIQEVVKLREIE